jgi:CubicO group peptidase (beta-lactamase class C family)
MIPRFAATVLLAGIALAQNIDSRMDQIVQSYVSGKQFMGSVLVARGDTVLFSKGYGSANLEWGVPVAPNTKFRLGSLTKQFTAASILLLEERGKLSVDDPVKKYMPDAPAAWAKMTIYNVLTHTAGIPNFTSFPDYLSTMGQPATPEKLVARFRDKPLDFEPGEKFNYSNSGYVLLGYLIEKISGESYQSFLQKNIFTPLGMKDSGYDSNSAVIERRASGYGASPSGITNAPYIDMTIPFSAGALYSTTEDLLRWEQGLFGGKLLKADSLKKMTTPFKNDYAFGLLVHTVNGHKLIEHDGGVNGFATRLNYFPEDKLVVVGLANLGNPAPIVNDLAQVAQGGTVTLTSERKEMTIDPAVLARYTGAYRMAPGADMLVTLEGGQLSSQLTGQPPTPLFAQSETMFFLKVVNAQIEFPATGPQAKAGQVTLHQNGRDMVGTRLDETDFKRLADSAASVAKRVKDQTAAPGSETALRRDIDELRQGQPKYDLMTAQMANITRQQLPQLTATITGLGAVQSIKFKGVGPAGADIYEVKFENGATEWRISLDADGKVAGMGFRPL